MVNGGVVALQFWLGMFVYFAPLHVLFASCCLSHVRVHAQCVPRPVDIATWGMASSMSACYCAFLLLSGTRGLSESHNDFMVVMWMIRHLFPPGYIICGREVH